MHCRALVEPSVLRHTNFRHWTTLKHLVNYKIHHGKKDFPFPVPENPPTGLDLMLQSWGECGFELQEMELWDEKEVMYHFKLSLILG
jgi:hypothetical protein